MTTPTATRRPTLVDIILGVLVLIAGLIVLANATVASLFSVVMIGWLCLLSGILGVISAFMSRGSGVRWSNVVAGALLVVLGFMLLRHGAVGLVALTLLAGALFLFGGIVRIIVGAQVPQHRLLLILSGVVSVMLGLLVFFDIFTASLTLLGILLGVEMIADGVTMILVGRPVGRL